MNIIKGKKEFFKGIGQIQFEGKDSTIQNSLLLARPWKSILSSPVRIGIRSMVTVRIHLADPHINFRGMKAVM
jgi:hypothetical protein